MAALGRGSSINMAAGAGLGKAASKGNARLQSASAVPSGGRMGACGVSAHARKPARVPRKAAQQAPLALESGGERGDEHFKERPLGGAAKMAAPSGMAVCGSLEPDNPHLSIGQERGKTF
ncbi:hypothetical protein NDU88_003869 [Pleurodeles waltl]|uniref:Uncharacterized protein n=1 Tax=Pleurodeles waltl TaxID=8319 RepID=A0AAV7QD91_PLEWA|nr:hypothetical protein NDU88_003869 [Pleurodeles waltl]